MKWKRAAVVSLALCCACSGIDGSQSGGEPARRRRRRAIGAAEASAAAAEVQRCNSSYAFLERRFLPPSALHREPVLLLSHQGSGNTWTRLLLEYSTGIYTGSVYSDTTLYDILPAEAECGRTMSVNRAHPDVCKISPGPGGYIYPRDKVPFSLPALFMRSPHYMRAAHTLLHSPPVHCQVWVTIHFSGYRRKCHRGQIFGYKRFLILLRDPFRSIWAEYQRVNTRGVHNMGIEKVAPTT